MSKDKRPDPKPRVNIKLWQTYLQYDELVEMRKRHLLRISSIEKGKSLMNAQIERDFIDKLKLDKHIAIAKKVMIHYGKTVGPIWGWVTSIKGLGAGGLAAQLLAQIDYPGPMPDRPDNFETVSKLWAFSGYAVVDGSRQWPKKGEKSPYNRRLKSIIYLIGDQFIKQQTPLYVDEYYKEKARLRRLYPEPVKTNNGRWPYKFTDSHVHRMARRKMVKIFLSHLWAKWREFEGLPITRPYAEAILGHENIVEPV
jgi:hypothetical protein